MNTVYGDEELAKRIKIDSKTLHEKDLLHFTKTPMSAAWRSGLEHRFYDDHNRRVNGSTLNLVSLLRPWIRCFTMIISAWWNLASSKLKKSEAKFKWKAWKQRQLLSEPGFVLSSAFVAFS